MRNRLVITGVALLAAIGIACGASDTDGTESTVGGGGQTTNQGNGDGGPDGPVTAAMGQTVTLTNTFLDSTDTIEVTLANPQQFKQAPGSSLLKPTNGVYLVIDATIVCTEGSYSASSSAFKFVAKDGTVYDFDLGIGFDGTLDPFTELNAGQRTAGKIVFDVPAAAISGAKIQLDGIGLDFDEPAAFWQL